MNVGAAPLRTVSATAPTRICDNGGWTDTWFAGHGNVFNIAVYPNVNVDIKVHPIDALPKRVMLNSTNVADPHGFESMNHLQQHPLLQATIDEIGVPEDLALEINVSSEAPMGSSTGTSASTTVALIGALHELTHKRLTRDEVAQTAHRIEVDRLGLESGVQDQLCAAYGGINYIEVSAYPRATVFPLLVSSNTWSELDRRLILLYLGQPHSSSSVHERVIAEAATAGEISPQLEALRQAAGRSREAVLEGDLEALGRAMIENTDAQTDLHPSLVGSKARTAIAVASSEGARGWKVNGAGGDGGSLTILAGTDPNDKKELICALLEADSRFEVIPTRLSHHGLQVSETRE
ncbi:MAG TPA: hypothetical protein VEJ87_01170 [Acidimicrobiales bacterium]|nr:hypothetical protein [Acidimicrobiales bacterium]